MLNMLRTSFNTFTVSLFKDTTKSLQPFLEKKANFSVKTTNE